MVKFNAELQIGKDGSDKVAWEVHFESDKERASVSELSKGLAQDVIGAENNLCNIPECVMDRLLIHDKDILFLLGAQEDRTLLVKVYAEDNVILSIMPNEQGSVS